MTDERMNNYTRVSTILSTYSDYDSIPKHILDKAATRGTLIHNMCELYAGTGVQIPNEHQGYVDAFVSWFDAEVKEVHSLETRLFCDTFELTGQYDMHVMLKNRLDYIIDIKTCAAKHDTWPLQLSAYQYLHGESKDGYVPRRAVLHLRKTGKYDFYQYDNDEKDKDLFMSALKLHRYFKKG